MTRFCESLLPVGMLLPFLLGCGASAQPVSPSSTPPSQLSSGADATSNSFAAAGARHWIWGTFDIILDPESGTAEIIPHRLESGHLNARRFLEETPCSNCLLVSDFAKVGPKEWLVDVQLRHPFIGLHYYTGFDVRGIVMLDASYTFPGSGLAYPDPSEPTGGALLNLDGYTTLFNPTDYPPGSAPWPAWEYQKGKYATAEFPGATLNPYKAYRVAAPRRYFGCTQIDILTYHIRFPQNGPLRFGYAIDANWAPPLEDPPTVPDDFPISANMPEAYQLRFKLTANTLWSDPSGGGGGDIRFKIKVYDHQDPHLLADGGTVSEFRWEIPGMTGWDAIAPVAWEDGADAAGPYVAYEFVEAPVPDVARSHHCLVAVTDTETGLHNIPETAYLITEIGVAFGETCWSPGEMIADRPSESYQAHLMNGRCTYIDDEGLFHLFYLDPDWAIHHLTHNGAVIDEIILPGEQGYNINAIRDSSGAVHLLYADDPRILGGNIVYRLIPPDGEIGPATILSASSRSNQFEPALAVAPDGDILAVWMDSHHQPGRRFCAAYYDGSGWTPEMTFRECHLPTGWVNPTLVADSSGVFHITFCDGSEMNYYYVQFEDGSLGSVSTLVEGPWRTQGGVMSIDSDDWIYATFQDCRTMGVRGYLTIRDPSTGIWSPEKDLIGHNYATRRFRHQLLPDGRFAVVWTDWRDGTRGLYLKVFDPFLPENEIQAFTDDEIDAPYDAMKNQTRLCITPEGTLHLVWTDLRADYWQLFYSTCTP